MQLNYLVNLSKSLVSKSATMGVSFGQNATLPYKAITL
jgi:hypothetical protein